VASDQFCPYLIIAGVEETPKMNVKTYQDLIEWQRAMDLIETVYKLSRDFPRHELYSLTNQIRRAAVSSASNIAEGQGRRTTSDFLRHLSIAYGSLLETETQLLIAERLKSTRQSRVAEAIKETAEVGRLLNGLMVSLSS
jgi:four helix bundle protein